MKKLFYLCFLVATFSVTNSVKAQYCGTSGSSVCTANQNFNTEGFFPSEDSMPCVVDGVPYDTVLQFHAPASADGYTINNIHLDNVTNLPCGLCWGSGDPNNNVGGNSTGCLRIQGTSYDAPGQYLVIVYADVTVSVPVIGNITESDLNIDTAAGLKYYSRVRLPGGPCALVDTLSQGLWAHTTGGSIITPTISGPSFVCQGGTATLTASGGSYYGYVWSNGSNASSITVSTAGTYGVTVFDNCTFATASQTITLNQPPTASISPAVDSVCLGGIATLTAGGGGSYTWNTGSSQASVNVAPIATTTYTVTVTGSNTCTATATSTVVVTPGLTAHITPASATVCAGQSVTLTASGGPNFSWSNGASIDSITVTPLTTTTYTVTVTNSTGCGATASRVVNVNSLTPVITPSGPTTLCSGGSVTLTINNGYTSYLWNTGDTTASIFVDTSGTFYAYVTASSGCAGTSDTINVQINSSSLTPIITASNTFDICPGGTTLLDVGPGYDSYAWSNSANGESIAVNSTGIYEVTVTEGACAGTAIAAVSVGNYLLNVNVTPGGPINLCNGDSVTLDAGPGFANYIWSDGETTQTITPLTSGVYTVTVSQPTACTGSSSVNVTINPIIQAAITPAGNQIVCSGQTLTLNAGTGYDRYQWSTGDTTQDITVNTSGTFYLSVIKNGCLGGSDTVNVLAGQTPSPVITPSGAQTLCSGQTLPLDAGAGYSQYAWSNGATTEIINVVAGGSYTVTVTQNGCSGSTDSAVNVSEIQSPVALISPSGVQTICSGQHVTLSTDTGFSSYLWSNGGTTSSISVTASGNYSVSVTQSGCSGSSLSPTTVNVNPTPTATATELGSQDGYALLQAGPGGVSYQWLLQQTSNGPYVFSSANQLDTVTCGSTAVYYTLVAAQNGCSDSSTRLTVICTGINDITSLTNFIIQPNPASDVLYVGYDLNASTPVHISVIDLTGRTVIEALNETEYKGTFKHAVAVRDLAPGVYLLNFMTENGSFNAKFVKQ